jgi:hypothetical protein
VGSELVQVGFRNCSCTTLLRPILTLGLKWLGREADQSPPSNVKVKIMRIYTSIYTSIHLYTILHSHRRENLKSYIYTSTLLIVAVHSSGCKLALSGVGGVLGEEWEGNPCVVGLHSNTCAMQPTSFSGSRISENDT